jgi:Na+-translocating ferredoxin:NAD+ oxidoreductase RnfA subunit
MPLVTVIFVLILLAVVLWLINTYGAPYMDANILKIINIVAVVGVVLWLVSLFIPFDSLNAIRVGHR